MNINYICTYLNNLYSKLELCESNTLNFWRKKSTSGFPQLTYNLKLIVPRSGIRKKQTQSVVDRHGFFRKPPPFVVHMVYGCPLGEYVFELVIPENYKLAEAKAKKDCNRLYCFCKPYETKGKKCTKMPHTDVTALT